MSECKYLQKKQADKGKGIKYDEVMAMIRPLLIAHGIVMVTNQESLETLNFVEGTKQKIYQGKFTLDLVNIDDPQDRVTHTCYAQGMDGGDKGAGKAHTYAMKTMLVKGFGIETGEDEESRSEKMEAIEEAKVVAFESHKKMILESQNKEELLKSWQTTSRMYAGKRELIELTDLKDARKKELGV